jgi:putative acetyltransferase
MKPFEHNLSTELKTVVIIEFENKYAQSFKLLNEQWITKYFKIESEDLLVLNNPYDYIINPGGKILLASLNNNIVGTCALLKKDQSHYELAKMAVSEEYQGKKIGKKLGQAAINLTRQSGGSRISLETSSLLIPAITLYESLGFTVQQNQCKSTYARCDVQMELVLQVIS